MTCLAHRNGNELGGNHECNCMMVLAAWRERVGRKAECRLGASGSLCANSILIHAEEPSPLPGWLGSEIHSPWKYKEPFYLETELRLLFPAISHLPSPLEEVIQLPPPHSLARVMRAHKNVNITDNVSHPP